MKKPLQIGLWGCGSMGGLLARALTSIQDARLAVAYDILPEAVAKMASRYGAQAVDSVEALLAYPALDGVIIALPSYLHATAVIRAAQAGLGIFVEKPLALNVSDCQRMIAAAKSHAVKFMVGHVMRYYEPYRSILRWQAEGRFGEIYAASIWRFFDGRRVAARGSWQAIRAKSGGYVFEIGVHELDMLRCLLGQPQSICAALRKVLPRKHDMEDYIAAQIRFAQGNVAVYEGGSGPTIGRYGFRLHFEGATLISDAALAPEALQVYDKQGQVLESLSDEFSSENPEEAELRDWLSALRDENPVPVPGEEGLATIVLAEAVLHSAKIGEIVAYSVKERKS